MFDVAQQGNLSHDVVWHENLIFNISFLIGQLLGAGQSGFGGGWEYSSFTPHPDRLWGPPSLLSNGYRKLFPRGKSGRGVKLTIHLLLVPRSRMCGAIPPPPNTSSWCGAYLRTGTTLLLLVEFTTADVSEFTDVSDYLAIHPHNFTRNVYGRGEYLKRNIRKNNS
jgi:hypothetical protein